MKCKYVNSIGWQPNPKEGQKVLIRTPEGFIKDTIVTGNKNNYVVTHECGKVSVNSVYTIQGTGLYMNYDDAVKKFGTARVDVNGVYVTDTPMKAPFYTGSTSPRYFTDGQNDVCIQYPGYGYIRAGKPSLLFQVRNISGLTIPEEIKDEVGIWDVTVEDSKVIM